MLQEGCAGRTAGVALASVVVVSHTEGPRAVLSTAGAAAEGSLRRAADGDGGGGIGPGNEAAAGAARPVAVTGSAVGAYDSAKTGSELTVRLGRRGNRTLLQGVVGASPTSSCCTHRCPQAAVIYTCLNATKTASATNHARTPRGLQVRLGRGAAHSSNPSQSRHRRHSCRHRGFLHLRDALVCFSANADERLTSARSERT